MNMKAGPATVPAADRWHRGALPTGQRGWFTDARIGGEPV